MLVEVVENFILQLGTELARNGGETSNSSPMVKIVIILEVEIQSLTTFD